MTLSLTGPRLSVGAVAGDDSINALDVARGLVLRGTTGLSTTSVTLTLPNVGTPISAPLLPSDQGQQWVAVVSSANVVDMGDGAKIFLVTASDGVRSASITRSVTAAPPEMPITLPFKSEKLTMAGLRLIMWMALS